MEYIITSALPFAEIEARTIEALERQGWVVQRSFSLRSASGARSEDADPGFCVLLAYGSGSRQEPLGLVTLYQRGEGTVIRPELASPADADLDAGLVAALLRVGLELCVDVAGADRCVDSARAAGEREEEHD